MPFHPSQILNGVLDFQQGGFILKILNGSIILRVYFDKVFCFWVAMRYHFLLTQFSIKIEHILHEDHCQIPCMLLLCDCWWKRCDVDPKILLVLLELVELLSGLGVAIVVLDSIVNTKTDKFFFLFFLVFLFFFVGFSWWLAIDDLLQHRHQLMWSVWVTIFNLTKKNPKTKHVVYILLRAFSSLKCKNNIRNCFLSAFFFVWISILNWFLVLVFPDQAPPFCFIFLTFK